MIKHELTPSFIELVPIDDITTLPEVRNMVDIQVEDDHTFIFANGLISHNSAISGMSAVRDPKIHGGLGLRGKVLNVYGESPKKVMENNALADIMNSLGLVIGEPANREKLRYGMVYIAHDMDPDGLNIGALLINFLYTNWKELFDPNQDPFVYIFMTPFIIAEKGKQRKYWYAHNHNDFKTEDYSGWTITRAKGLGTLTKEDWAHSLRQPEVYGIVDDGSMAETLDLIFNPKRAEDRRNWIGVFAGDTTND